MSQFYSGRSDLLPGSTYEIADEHGNFIPVSSTVATLEPPALPENSLLPQWSDALSTAWAKGKQSLYAAWAKLIGDATAGRGFDADKAARLMRDLGYSPADLQSAVADRQKREAWAAEVAKLSDVQLRYDALNQALGDLLQDRPRKLRAINEEIAAARSALSEVNAELERLKGIERNLRLGKPREEELSLRDAIGPLERDRDAQKTEVDSLRASVAALPEVIRVAPTEAVLARAAEEFAGGGMPGVFSPQYTKEHLLAFKNLQEMKLKEAEGRLAALDAKIAPIAARLAEIEADQLQP